MASGIPDLFPVPGKLDDFALEPTAAHVGDEGQVGKVTSFIRRQLQRAGDAGRPYQCFVKAAGMMDVNDPSGRLQRMTVADGSWLICVWIGCPTGTPGTPPVMPRVRQRFANLFALSAEREPATKEDERPGAYDTELDEVCDFIKRQCMRADDDSRPWQARVMEAGIKTGIGPGRVQAADAWLICVYIGKPQFTKAYLLPTLTAKE